MKRLIIPIFFLLISMAACSRRSSGPDIEVVSPWVRAAGVMEMGDQGDSSMEDQAHEVGMGTNTAGYMVLENRGNQDDKLIGVITDVAEVVELHESKLENDVMKMQQVSFIDLPAVSKIELKPGSLHIMLIGLKEELKQGEKVNLTLEFDVSDDVTVEAEIRMP